MSRARCWTATRRDEIYENSRADGYYRGRWIVARPNEGSGWLYDGVSSSKKKDFAVGEVKPKRRGGLRMALELLVAGHTARWRKLSAGCRGGICIWGG